MYKRKTKRPKNRDRISLGHLQREVLYKEFDTTKTSIDNALMYKTDSDLARSIRKRAKELLQEEVKKVKIELYED